MAKITYSEKLKDPRWQKMRLEVLHRDKFMCQFCGDETSTLHVHHKKYEKGDPWEIDPKFLITLCESCHEDETNDRSAADKNLITALTSHHFSSYDINRISNGFSKLTMPHHPEVFASVIEWTLGNDGILNALVEEYFNHLHRERVKKEGGNG